MLSFFAELLLGLCAKIFAELLLGFCAKFFRRTVTRVLC